MIQKKENIIQNLKDIGLNQEDIKKYLCLYESNDINKQIFILKKHRCFLLEKLHLIQKEIYNLDYLIYNIKNNKCTNNLDKNDQ